jgi:hypothetical protein
VLDDAGGDGFLGTPDQVGTGVGEQSPERLGRVATIGEQEHAGRDRSDQAGGQAVLTLVVVIEFGIEEGAGAALDQGHDPRLRLSRPFAVVGGRAAECLLQLRDSCQLDGGAVDGDHPPAKPEAAVVPVGVGKRLGEGPEEAFHDLCAQPVASPSEGGVTGWRPGARSVGDLGQVVHELVVAEVGTQTHDEVGVDGQASW